MCGSWREDVVRHLCRGLSLLPLVLVPATQRTEGQRPSREAELRLYLNALQGGAGQRQGGHRQVCLNREERKEKRREEREAH